MKKLSKAIFLATPCLVAAVITSSLLASCASKPGDKEGCLEQFNDYLYGVEYDDYDFKAGVEIFEKRYGSIAPAACSEVRKGNFVGRNLDWYINSDLSAVIRVNAKGTPSDDNFYTARYASIGMVGCMPEFGTDKVSNTTDYLPIYELLPMATSDGINEKGVYIGVNVTATGETSMDTTKWKDHQWGLGAAFTNPESDKNLCVTYLVRTILDHASSVEDAIRIVKSINWYEPVNFPHQGETQSFHWLISDKTTSCILEFIDNAPVFVQTNDVNTPSLATIMTNFNNYLMQKGIIQDHGIGYERWDLLNSCYASTPETVEGMQGLMEKVWYSKSYTMSLDEPNYWTTENPNEYFTASQMYKHPEVLKDEKYKEVVSNNLAIFNDRAKWHTPECGAWYSTHTSIYDLTTRSLTVKLHEGFDGMNDYMTFDFDSTFPKPLIKKNK